MLESVNCRVDLKSALAMRSVERALLSTQRLSISEFALNRTQGELIGASDIEINPALLPGLVLSGLGH